jgi:hypothetical protein
VEEVTGGWRKLQNVELYVLFSSPNIIIMIKYRGIKWVGPVTHLRKMRNATGIGFFRKTSRDRFGDVGVDGRAILKRILKKIGCEVVH